MKAGTLMLVAIVSLFLAACGGGGAPDGSETAQQDTPGVPGMGQMEGMGGMEGMPGGDMMERMHAHMQSMQAMHADSMQHMMPMHRQLVANMIASMNREMRDMNMPADAAWHATVDSLRSDLVAIPEMDTAELEALMPAHHRRVMRLMEMHGAMMSAMGM